MLCYGGHLGKGLLHCKSPSVYPKGIAQADTLVHRGTSKSVVEIDVRAMSPVS